jgi:hypothetical protein
MVMANITLNGGVLDDQAQANNGNVAGDALP